MSQIKFGYAAGCETVAPPCRRRCFS